MRPLALTLQGFRSHEATTELDLAGRSLIAIVGPTGSGKSSILDAMSYALYGKTARVKAGITRLVSSRSEVANIRFVFSIDERRWQVTRTLQRKGSGGQHVLEDLGSGEKIIGATDVTKKIEELLGLDFEAFTASVLLAQGQFSRFLEAATTERMKILKGVFRYDQIDELRTAAKRRISALELDLAKIEGERKSFPEDPRAGLEIVRREAKEWSARAGTFEEAVPREKDLRKSLDEADIAVADAERASLSALEGLKKIPPADEFEAVTQEEGVIDSRFADAGQKSKRAADELTGARTELDALEARLGGEAELRDALAEARRLDEVAREFAALEEEASRLKASVSSIEGKVADCGSAERSAAVSLEDARAQQREVEQAHKAHALRAHLVPGEPCPVCEQDVRARPKGRAPAALGSVAKKVKVAETEHESATKVLAGAEKELDRTKERLKMTLGALEKEKNRFTELDAALKKMVGRVKDPGAEITERLEQLGEAKKRVDDTLVLVERARQDLEEVRARREFFATRKQKLAVALVEIAGRFELASPDIDAPADKLASHAEHARSAIESLIAKARDSLEKARGAREKARAELEELVVSLDLEPGDSIAESFAEARKETGLLAKQASDLEGAIKRSKELDELESGLNDKVQVFDQLKNDMRNERFINFLLEDRRMLLSELGSARLREMTSRYRFDDKGEFNIVDELDADKVRDVGTLSGGETFLASLALALALAEGVARYGGRLQCFFIDEGFGSLDPESLDLALDGIEKIVGPDRLIGLVSHVAELGRRVEDKIVLDKSPDGTTIVVSGAA